MKRGCIISVLGVMLTCGCASSTVVPIDRARDTEATTALSYRDFERIAADVSTSLLASGRLPRSSTPHVLAIGRVVNDTCLHFPPALLTAKIAEALTNSGRVRITSALAADPAGTEQLIAATRQRRTHTEFDPTTIAAQGHLLAPDLALAGRITQRNIRRDNGGLQIEYHYHFHVTDLKTGLQIWQHPGMVGKRVPPHWPAW